MRKRPRGRLRKAVISASACSQSYVTQDKIYCVYLAENEADIRSHAKAGGFPANRVSRIMTMIDPTSGN
jgi:Nickel responsive protein SCO4226-like